MKTNINNDGDLKVSHQSQQKGGATAVAVSIDEKTSINLKSKKNKDLLPKFQAHIEHSFDNAELSREERVDDWQDSWMYYRSLKPVLKGGNHFTSPVLRDTVDSIVPSMLNVFCENDSEAVMFRSRSRFIEHKITELINNEINDIFLRQNNGYETLYKCILEALVTGNCYGKVYSCDEVVTEEISFSEWAPIPVLMAILEEYPDTDVEQFTTKLDKELGMEVFKSDGEVELVRIDTKQKFDYIPFGELYVDPLATSIESARYICHRTMHTKGELLDMFPDQVEAVQAANTINGLSESNTSNIKLETLKAHASKEDYYVSNIDDMESTVYLYEHWVYSSLLNKDGKTKYYQVFTVDGEANHVLEVNEVEPCDNPFIKGEVEPLPDSFWGISLYSKLKHEQDMMSRLTMQISDNGEAANHRRYTAVRGQYDKKSLLDNRIGGVVEVNSPGAVDTFPYHQLPQATNDLYSKLSERVNESKGNAVGLDLQGSLNNVAASTVAMAVQNMEMQDKKYSKAFALSFVKPLFDKIYKKIKASDYVIEHEHTKFPSSSLPKNYEFTVDVNTSNDGARIVGQLMNIAMTEAQLSQSQSTIVDAQKRYEIYAESLKVTGTNPDKYLNNPEDNKPTPEQMQEAQKQKALQDEIAHLQLEKLKLEVMKGSADIVKMEADIKSDQQKNAIQYADVISQAEKRNTDAQLDEVKTGVETMMKGQEMKREDLVSDLDLNQHLNTGEPIPAQYHIS
ncbi:hypothetical protein BCU90_17415 [Vibrio lentus]|uniref:portal protein n=1 Tax=Vibrio lentus TaxID=136468 RepID=UPI000C8478E7|nr:hypothetical protein [Vibrio lentus]PMG45643.1 hypothetical protein BCU90_17415 [Vibrio lentus]